MAARGGADGEGRWTEEMLTVLPIILSKLNLRDKGRAMQVCRAWRAAAQDGALWRDIDFRTCRLTPGMVSAFSSWCGALDHLHLGGRDNSLQACRLRAPALRALSLDNLEPKSTAAVAALGAAFPGLLRLSVVHSHKMSASALTAFATLCPLLTELHLDDTLNLSPSALAAVPSFANLTSLSLRYCALSPGWSLSSCANLASLSLAGALDSEDPDQALSLAALPASLRRLDVSLVRAAPAELRAWLTEAPGRLLAAFGTVDAIARRPFPAAVPASPSSSPRSGRVVSDLDVRAAAAEEGPDACWLHGVLTHAVWAFLSLREAEDGAPAPPPPGPTEPQLRASSADLVAAGVLLSSSANDEVRECATGMLSSLANCPMHMGAMLSDGGLLALLRQLACPDSELVAELAAEGVRNLSYQAARAAEDEDPEPPGRSLLLSPYVLGVLVAAWRSGAPRMRHYAALTLSDVGRMVIHFAPDSSPEQVNALRSLLAAGVIPVYIELTRAPEAGDQYAGSRPLAIMSFLGRSGQEPFYFGNHEQASTNIQAMVDSGAVAPLLALVGVGHDHDIRAEAVGVVRNCCFANTVAAAAFAAADAASVLSELASSTEAELQTNNAVESAVTALCNLACVSDVTAAAVARSGAPAVLARLAADDANSMRWVATVALCGLEAHGAVPRTTAVASLQKLLRGVSAHGDWLVPPDRKTLVTQVLLQLAWCTEDDATRVLVCRALATLARDADMAQLVRQEGGREVLRLCSQRSRALRVEAERAAAVLSLVLSDTAPRASPRLRGASATEGTP